MRCTFIGFITLLSILGSPARSAPPIWTGDPARAAAELERQWPAIADAKQVLGIRGTLRFGLEASGLRWHPERVETAIARARAMQDLDPGSLNRGNFKWRSDHPSVLDRNGVEFAVQLAALLRLRFSDTLTPSARTTLEALLTDAVAGLRGHEVKVEYTNIFVMKAWGLIATGEALGQPDVASDGYARWQSWLKFTARHGIGEYGAVTYYGVDLDSLALLARFAGRPEVRAQAATAMHYLWADIAAIWWAPGDRLSGANARSYDYLYGRGYLEAHTWTAGWLRARPELEGAGWLGGAHDNQTVLRDLVTMPPPAEWTEPIRTQIPRTVVQRWGREPEHRAVNWIGRHVSIASSGSSRGTDERTLVANLGNSPDVPQLTLFMDGRGDPFGTNKIANAANQAKALHLTPFLATVQRGPDVLQVLSLEPLGPKTRYNAGELACFLTHLTLPANTEVWLGDERAKPGTAENPTVIPGEKPFFIRLGAGALGVRVLLATTTSGDPAPIHYIADGRKAVAHRLTISHSTSEPTGRGTVVVWVQATDNLEDTAFSAWRKKFSAARATVRMHGNIVEARASGLSGPLRIEADVEKGERRLLQGGEPDALLGVNDRDLGREILGAFSRGTGP